MACIQPWGFKKGRELRLRDRIKTPWLNISTDFVNGKKYGGGISRIGVDIHNLAFLYHEYIIVYMNINVKH